MRTNRARGTVPERALGVAIERLGFRISRNVATLPGTPDVVVRGIRLVVFMHGCFWHGCPVHWKAPATRSAYWIGKIRRNRKRDAQAVARLRLAGWKVAVVWEHDVRASPRSAALKAVGVAVRPAVR